MRCLIAVLALSLSVTACSKPSSDEKDSAPAVPVGDANPSVTGEGEEPGNNVASTVSTLTDRDAWVGRWIGVEGLNLTVSKTASKGHYLLEMQYGTDTEMSGNFDGVGTPEGIAFTRSDGPQTLRASTGDQTGLKYLAGKTDCLRVKDGEGYCRK